MTSKDPIFLDCPYIEKDEAKKLGARYNGALKKWFIPPGLDTEPFARWLPKQELATSVETADSLSLHELLLKVKQTVEQQHATRYWVRAEIVHLSRKAHLYLELADHDSQGQELAHARATIWNDRANTLLPRFEQLTGLPFQSGIKVLLQTHLQFHPLYGLSLNVLDIVPHFTLGDLEAKFNRIRIQLTQEGIYIQNKQFPPIKEFCKVAVLAPPQAAGLGDFQSQADLLVTHGLCEFHYYFATFQGAQAVTEIPAAIATINQDHQHQHYDALVIIRGGGAKMDIYQLNEYPIAKALCTAELPVIVGIGHERDKTLLDDVAYHSCHTPSLVITYIQAIIVQNAQQAQQHWQWSFKLAQDALQRATLLNERLHAQIRHQAVQQLGEHKSGLATLLQEIKHAGQLQLQKAQHRVKLLMGQVVLGNPKLILKRGYAIIRNSQNQVLTTKAKASQESSLIIEFQDGRLTCSKTK